MKKNVMDEVKRLFRPEFLNRIDDIVVFHSLNEENIKEIVKLLAKDIINRIQENMDITVEFSPEAVEAIAKEGFDPDYGARPLRRALQNKVEDQFAEEFLSNRFTAGDHVIIGADSEGKITFTKQEDAAEK